MKRWLVMAHSTLPLAAAPSAEEPRAPLAAPGPEAARLAWVRAVARVQLALARLRLLTGALPSDGGAP